MPGHSFLASQIPKSAPLLPLTKPLPPLKPASSPPLHSLPPLCRVAFFLAGLSPPLFFPTERLLRHRRRILLIIIHRARVSIPAHTKTIPYTTHTEHHGRPHKTASASPPPPPPPRRRGPGFLLGRAQGNSSSSRSSRSRSRPLPAPDTDHHHHLVFILRQMHQQRVVRRGGGCDGTAGQDARDGQWGEQEGV